MIVKHIANPKTRSGKASRIGGLLDYIAADGQDNEQKAEYVAASGNFYSDSLQGRRAEMIALALEAPRSKDPVDHWLMSWKEGEQPTEVQCRESVEILKRYLGMGGDHLAIYALHRNTENYHLHVVINRVDPDSHRVADKGWCIDRAHKAIAEIVHLHGWEPESNARYIANSEGEVSLSGVAHERNPKAKVMDRENAIGEKSNERIAIETAGPILANSQSWDQVRINLARAGMRYELKGSGALLWVGEQPVKASVIGREFSKKRMEERLGVFQPDSNRGRMDEASRKPEPLREDHSGHWHEYRKLLERHRTGKDAAQIKQRVAHREARDAQLASFRQERSELYAGARWSGSALNVARSLMASEHARRKAQLMEEHKRERGVLQQQFGHRPTFEQFLLARGGQQLAQAWRYRENHEVGCGLLGEGDDPPHKRDIRDFTGQVQHTQDGKSWVHYSKRDSKGISFTDQGRRIDVWETSDEAAVLAALQLGAQKWGNLTITGSMEFKLLCAEVAAKHGIRIINPELQHVVPPVGKMPAPRPEIATGTAPLESAYLCHKTDIQNRLHLVDPSRLDWMIAVRMRVTGHDKRSIATALREHAPRGRTKENRDWGNYSERTAYAVFSVRGDHEATRNLPRAHAWMQVEGRQFSREALTSRERPRPSRSIDRSSPEPEI
ncbi:TraI/MobA(P) family conjugative relaxase [Acidicapsa ligni]|uniref:TraI/MobA(P) family conjugative relaxase n=1 Tax=Acidicapsa ligni TaxID=542300 RepID=UPI0021DF5CA5|nr:TraI/MobA(P) family conjugative relaxase [Acidicapsa ligni]